MITLICILGATNLVLAFLFVMALKGRRLAVNDADTLAKDMQWYYNRWQTMGAKITSLEKEVQRRTLQAKRLAEELFCIKQRYDAVTSAVNDARDVDLLALDKYISMKLKEL